jgi:TP901 family phage tail tape measure protein
MQALGPVGLAGAIAAVGFAMAGVITKGAEFEQTLVGAAARFGDGIDKNSKQFERMSDLARRLGADTEFTASQAAGGLNFLAKAGFNAELSMRLLPGIVDLATASELDLARASDIATDALGAFGLATGTNEQIQKRFVKLSDQMAKTTRISNVNMEELFETIKKGGPAATAAGVPVETFLGFTAQLAGAGLKASDAGTALKNIFLQLVKVPVQKKLKGIGVAVLDSENKMRDFADIIDDIKTAFDDKGLSKAQGAGFLNEVFGLRGITGAATAIANGTAQFRGLRDSISNSVGETENLAEVLRDTRAGKIKEMQSAFESLQLSISAANNEGILALIEGVRDALRATDAFVQRNPGLTKFLGIMLAIGAAALVVAGVFAAVSAAVAFVAGSAAALVTLVAGVAIGIGKWIGELKPVQDFFDKIFSSSVFNFITGNLDAEAAASRAEIAGPQRRIGETIEERRERSTAEITIRDETGRAELEKTGRFAGIDMEFAPSGGF